MVTENPGSSSVPDDEIDLLEVASALLRRWIWVASFGLLGVAIAGISILVRPDQKPLKVIRMVVDTSQGPCIWTERKFLKFENSEILNIKCNGEFLSARRELTRLASDEFSSGKALSVKIQPFTFGTKKDRNSTVSKTQLELVIESDEGSMDDIKAQLEKLKRRFADNRLSNIKNLSPVAEAGKNWITVDNGVVVMPKPNSSYKQLALGLLGGLVMGSGAALIADHKSNREFNNSKILRQLGYPLWLALPTLPWPDQVAGPMIGQLAARLDPSLDWRVLSIAHEHEGVGPLAQALTRQNEPGLSCRSVAPLLNSIIRLGSDSRPIGLLVVVESGFNSIQALADARLLLSQLTCVQSIGIVLAGVTLPSELTVGEKA